MSASKAFAFSLALLLGAGGQASAQAPIVYNEVVESGMDSSGSVSGATPIGSAGGYFWVNGDFGERPGINGNYASFGSFAPIDFLGSDQQFFLDVQGMVNDGANMGASAGLGYRQLVDRWGSIFGVNSYYTFDQSQRGFSYNQGGFGAEWLTQYFQVTANAYVPFNTAPNNLGPVIQTNNAIFQNHNLAFINIQNAEAQARGGDVEVSVPIPGLQWMSVAGGAYYLDAQNADAVNGVRGRVQADLSNVLLNLTYNKDDLYGSQVNFAATYLFGAQNGNYNPRVKSLYDRMNDRVRRTTRIATQFTTVNPIELAINPATGLPWTFDHFDNTAAAGGNGSNELRYNTLIASSPADALLFYRGTTSRTNLLTGPTGITLNDNQLVFGEGCPALIPVANRPGPLIPLPNFDPAGANPFVGSAAGNVFTLADNNRIAGLNIIAPTGGNAIFGSGINNFRLEKLNRNIDPTIPGPNGTTGTGGGIVLTNASGTGVIQDFGFNIPSTNGPSGIVIDNTNTAPLNVSITDGRFLDGGRFGILLRGNSSDITASIDNVHNDSSATGLQVQAIASGAGENVSVTVTNSNFDNAVGGVPGSGDGIAVIGNNGDVVLNVSNTTALNAARDGLHVDLVNGSTGILTLNTLNLSSAGVDAIFTNVNGSTLNLTGTGVNGTGAGDDGYDFRVSTAGTLNALLTGSNLSGATGDGIIGLVTGASTANLNVNGTSVANAGGNGLFVTTNGDSDFVGRLTNSSLDSADLNGVRLDTLGGSRSTLFLTNSDATNAALNGLLSTTTGGSRTDLVMVDQGFDGAVLEDAINLNATSNSTVIVTGNNVSGANAGDDGIQITANDSLVDLTFINTGSFVSPGDDGINFTGTNTSTVNINIDGSPSSFNGAGGDGIEGNLTDSTSRLVLTDVTFQGATEEGIGVTALNSIFNGVVTNGSFNDAGATGARLTLSNSTGNLTLDNTDVFSAGLDALLVNATNGSDSVVNLLNGISLGSAGDDAIDVISNDSVVTVQGSQVTGSLATDDAIHLAANNGDINLLLANAGSFTSPGGDGIDFTGVNTSNLNIQVQGFPLSSFDNAGRNGVIGVLTGASTANLVLTNTSFDNATLEGMGVTATNSTFNGAVTNGSFDDAQGGDAVRMTLNNSIGNLTLNNVTALRAAGNGLRVDADNGSTATASLLNGVALNDAGLDAMNLRANNLSSVTVTGDGVSGARAGNDGIHITSNLNSLVDLTLINTGSFVDATGDGIDFSGTANGDVNINISGALASFDGANRNGIIGVLNASDATLNLDGPNFRNAGIDGLHLELVAGSTLTGNIVDSNFSRDVQSGDDGLEILLNASAATLNFTNSPVDNAGDDAIHIEAINASLFNMKFTGGSLLNAGGDMTDITFLGGSVVNFNLDPVATGAGENGLRFLGDGVGSRLNAIISNSDMSVAADPVGENGILGTLTNQAVANVTLNDSDIANATLDGINVNASGNSTFNATLNNSQVSRAGGDGLDLTLVNSTSTVTFNNSDLDNATLDGIQVNASGNSTFNATLNNSQVSRAGGDGLDLTLVNSTSTVTFNNSDLDNAGNDAIRANGTGSTFTLNLNGGIALDDAGGDAMEFNANASLFTINGNSDVTGNRAGGDGLRVNALAGSTVNATFNGILDLDTAGGDGLQLDANASRITFVANQAVTANDTVVGDGLRLNSLAGSTVNATFNGILDVDNANDNAIDVIAANSTANVIVNGLATGANAGNDAIQINAATANATVQLFNAGSFADAGGDGIDIAGDNSVIGLRFSGASAGAANLDRATDNGIVANLTNNTLAQFIVDDFTIQGSGLNGINLGLNNSDIVGSTFVNGQIDNNGQDGTAGSRNGLRIVADNTSNVGNRVGNVPGLTFDTVTFQNDAANPRPQEHGINVSVDGDSFVGVNVLNAEIRRNDGDGVLLNVNPNASLNDSSLAVLTFNNTNIDNNWGDGINVTATNGIDDVMPPQLSGAIINLFNSEINNNGNFINAPATGAIGDGIGFGVSATANGDNTVAGNTQITFNFNNTDILGNEEGPFNVAMNNGGSVNINLVGGNVDGNLNIGCADGPLSFVSFTLDGTNIGSATSLELCAKNGGTVNATVANVDFNNNAGHGIVILAETGGDITANLSNINVMGNGANPVSPASDVNPPITTVTGAIQGLVDGAGSTLNLTMDQMTVTGNQRAGLDLTVSNGAGLITSISNSNFSNNGLAGAFDGLLIDVSGVGSTAVVVLNNVLADNATDDGFDFLATAGGAINLTGQTLSAQNAAADGFTLLVDAGTGLLNLNGLNVNDADGRAVNLIVDNAGTLAVPALNNVQGLRAGQEGLNLDVLNGSALTNFQANTLNLADSGRLNAAANGIDALIDTGSTAAGLNLTNVNADNAQGTGLQIISTAAATSLGNVNVLGGSFLSAGNNGVDVQVADQVIPLNVVLRNVAANDAGNFGTRVSLTNVTGGQSDVVIDNVDANNAGGDDGLEINVTGLGATDSTQVHVLNGSSFNTAANEGVDINLNGAVGSLADVKFNLVSANGATNDGINISPTGGLNLFVNQFDNVSATGAGGDGLEVIAAGPSGLRRFISNTVDVNGATGHGVNMQALGPQSGSAVISFNGLDASDAGGSGVLVNLQSVPGASSIGLANVDASGALGGDGVNIDVTMFGAGDSTAITLNTVNVSRAFADGLNVNIDGNGTPGATTATLALDGLTATNNIRDGIDFSLDQGVTATVTQFDNVISTLNGENGMQVDVENGSTLTAFIASVLDLSDNGTSGIGFDGLDVQVHDAGSSAAFDFSTSLTINRSGGRGIDLDVFDGGTLAFNVDTATIGNSGLGGIDINVGSLDEFGSPVVAGVPGTFTSNLTDVTVTNSGQSAVFTADGVNIDVDGAGSVANVTLDHVVSNLNDGDGFDIRVDNGADGTFAVNNATTGNNNGNGSGEIGNGVGFKFIADGAATTVSLTSASGVLGDNTFNNNTGDTGTLLDGPGVSVVLTNGVTASNLVIGASASGNDGDGLQILANDGTGVTINNFGISGTALQVNNNAGNGLFVDLFNVNGVTAFDLANLTVTGNAVDQIHAQFRQMPGGMDHISLNNITTTGIVGSDDGIEISLLDTQLTRLPAAGYAFSATNVVSTNNGGFGLNLSVDESGVPDGVQTSGITNGLIRASEFANNAAGVRMTFGGDSQADFDIIDNIVGFHDNVGEGILIEVEDAAIYRMNGTNLVLAGANSMYNNQIVNNGGVGFHVVASEPLDVSNVVPDGVGPRIELDLGDILRNPNTITRNTDAAMAIEMSNDATGSFNMVNTIMTFTTNGADANLNGDGLAFRLTDFSSLESLTIDGQAAGLDISDNAGSGLVTNISRFAQLGTLSRLTVLNTTIQRNTLHGIDIQREDNALYGPDAFNNAIIIGSANNGNVIRDNTQNGLNIVLGNSPGGILPLDIDVTDNTFDRNLNGIFLNATGNAQFVGNVSDNDFDANNQDGIQVVLENDAAIGDPRLLTNPLSIPFMFEGNQVLNSVRDGIRFDTNFTNESGPFGGGAYANVLITESANFVDGFAAPVRTLIDGNGANGVHIIDNSDFFATPGVAVTEQNTYRIINSDITNNTVDGVRLSVASVGNAIDINNGVALIIGDPTDPDQRDVQINFNGDDGIDMVMADSNQIVNNIRISHTTVNGNGATGDATGGNGIYTNLTGVAQMDMLLETLEVMNNSDDGIRFDETSGGGNGAMTLEGTALTTSAVSLVEMFGVDASQNGGRGLYASLEVNNSATMAFNIGRGDRFNDPTAVNRFNSNAREGVVFDQQATSLSQATVNVAANFPHYFQTDVNPDVFVDVNLPGGITTGAALWSTNQNLHTIAGTNFGTLSGLTSQETTRHQTATVHFIQNEVANNGTSFEDGLVFAVGSLTRLNAEIAGNSFGGNSGDDMRIYSQRSNGLNPPNSFSDPAGDGPHSFAVHDPVAYADLRLGSVDTDLDGFQDQNWGNGRSVDANGAASNGTGAGEQIAILHLGTNQTIPITVDGVYTNVDPVKLGDRSVLLVGQIQANGVWNDEMVNDFFQNGSQQVLDTTDFFFFNQNPGGNLPEPLFPVLQ